MAPLTITIIQTDLFWENKQANLDMLEAKINSIQGHKEVVVLPEMFSTGFSMQPTLFAETMEGNTVAWMKRMAVNNKIILTGSIIVQEGEYFYNRLIWMLPTGQYGCYNKRHLFAYGGEHNHYTAGNKRLIAAVKGWKINLQICYDLRFPVWARQSNNKTNDELPLNEKNEETLYDLLINVANWPQKRNHAWKTLLQARAIENQCFVVGVNRVGTDGNEIYHSGDSMVINPLGEILYHTEATENIYTITLQKSELTEIRTQLPFWKDADDFRII